MSRVGRKPVQIPKGISVLQYGNTLKVNGPKGTLSQVVNHPISFEILENKVFVSPKEQIKNISAFWGLYTKYDYWSG